MDTLNYPPNVQKLVDSVLAAPAESSPEMRQAVEAFAARTAGGRRVDAELPENLRSYIDKVSRHAYKVTDKDINRLIEAGYSEDELFELTICAALGAGLARLEKTMSLLGGASI